MHCSQQIKLFFIFRTLVNNHIFFQHPDLINILRVHENVIAIMMTSIARASQDSGEQSGEPGGPEEVAVVQEVCIEIFPFFAANIF